MDEQFSNTSVEIVARLDAQDEKLEKIFRSVERTRKYFLWTLVISILLFVLPLAGLFFIVPYFLNTYLNSFQGLL